MSEEEKNMNTSIEIEELEHDKFIRLHNQYVDHYVRKIINCPLTESEKIFLLGRASIYHFIYLFEPTKQKELEESYELKSKTDHELLIEIVKLLRNQ
jgi:hypothetical protein